MGYKYTEEAGNVYLGMKTAMKTIITEQQEKQTSREAKKNNCRKNKAKTKTKQKVRTQDIWKFRKLSGRFKHDEQP